MNTISAIPVPLFSALTAPKPRHQNSGAIAKRPAAQNIDSLEIRFGEGKGGGGLSHLLDALSKRAKYTFEHGGKTTNRDETFQAFAKAVKNADAESLVAFYADIMLPISNINDHLPRMSTQVLDVISEKAVTLGISLETEAQRHILKRTIAESLGKLDLPGRNQAYFDHAGINELQTEATRLSEIARLRENILALQIEHEQPLDEDLQRSMDLARLKVAAQALQEDLPIKAEERPKTPSADFRPHQTPGGLL